MRSHYRTIAGNLEFFLGAYFIDFGLLGLLFFWRRFENRDGLFASAAAIVVGLFLMARARHLLAWHRAIFFLVAALAVVVPVALLLPTLLRWR